MWRGTSEVLVQNSPSQRYENVRIFKGRGTKKEVDRRSDDNCEIKSRNNDRNFRKTEMQERLVYHEATGVYGTIDITDNPEMT